MVRWKDAYTQSYSKELRRSNTDGQVMHLVLWDARLTEDVKGVEIQLDRRMKFLRMWNQSRCLVNVCIFIVCERAGRTALIPQNWTPAHGMARVRSCHLTQREVRTSFTVFAFSPFVRSRSFSMSSSSSFISLSCHSHFKAVTQKIISNPLWWRIET